MAPNFFENNYVVFCVLVFLLLKMLLVFLVTRFVPESVRKHFNDKLVYLEVFLVEFTINSTTMSISALSVLLHSGVANPEEKANCLLQVFLLGTIISMPFLYYFVLISKNYKKIGEKEQKEQKEENEKKSRKSRKYKRNKRNKKRISSRMKLKR